MYNRAITNSALPGLESSVVLKGHLCVNNSTNTPLSAGAVFTGSWEDVLDYGVISIGVVADQDSATNGLVVQWSHNASAAVDSDEFTITANRGKTFTFGPARRYFRVVYTNGAVDQTDFHLETALRRVYVKPSSHRINDTIVAQDDSELVKAVLTAEGPAGVFANISASLSNNLKVADAENNLAISRGLVVNHSAVHKFGRGANIDTVDGFVDLWDGSEYDNALKTMTYSTTADIDRLSSSSASDTVPIRVFGLDANWVEVEQLVTLTGQTPVALTTPLIRAFRMINEGTSNLVGNVFCFVNAATTAGVPNTITNTRAMIINGNNQTLMTHYSVPAGKTAYLISWYAALSSRKLSINSLEMKARPFGKVFQLKHTSTLLSAGTSNVQHAFVIPQAFPEKTDFVMRADSDINDSAVSAGFDLILIDN